MKILSIGEAMVELSQVQDPSGHWQLGYAGDTFNTAWYLRRQLPQSFEVAYFTRLGADPFSGRLLEFMHKSGVTTEFIRRDPQASVGLYAIELENGERSFAYWRGQSAARALADDPKALEIAFDTADVLYLSGVTLAILPPEARQTLLSAVGKARTAGKLTIFDPNLRPRLWETPETMRDWLMRAGAVSEIVLPSFDDEALHFNDADLQSCALRWQKAGAREVIVKNGGGSLLLLTQDGFESVEVERIQPVDSTGAGDSFNAAYLAARLQGASASASALAGHALAQRVIGHPGALLPL